MQGWELSKLHWAGKTAITAFLCAVGVGFIFSTLQITTHHGGIGYRAIADDYYGDAAMRDSLDRYWADVATDLLDRYRQGPESQEPEETPMTFSVDDLDELESRTRRGEHESLLREARSEAHLKRLIDERHERDLIVQLGIPSVKGLISLAHTHTFGHVAFLFPVSLLVLLTGLPWKRKGLVAAAPHVGVILDYPSALATRLVAPEFALVLILAGVLMGLGYLAGFILTLYELWFKRPQAAS